MKFVNLGSSGLKVSRICLGCMTYGTKKPGKTVLEEDEARPFFLRALELGINFFDTADVYSLGVSEEILGRALKQIGVGRERVVISTKVFNPTGDDINQRGLSRKHIRHAIDDSLRRLGTDYVDLYQIHRFDPNTPVEETLEALTSVVKAGKALYIGASSMYAWQFARMLHTSDRLGLSRFVSMQNSYNLVYREEEREMIPLCRSEGIGLIPWGPLARGFLAGDQGNSETNRGKKSEFYLESDFTVLDKVTELARQRNISNAEVSIAWILRQPGITASIVGASKMQHLEEAVRALDLELGDDELKMLAEPYQPHRIMGHS
jgi:1-deoxyxylulose-5-phosphate synthase